MLAIIALIIVSCSIVSGDLKKNYILRADTLPFNEGTDLQVVMDSCSEYRGTHQIDVVLPMQEYDPEKPSIDRLIIHVDVNDKLTSKPILLGFVPNVKLVGNLVGKHYREARSVLKDLFPSEKIYVTDGSTVLHSEGNERGRSFYLLTDKDGVVVDKLEYRYPFLFKQEGTCYQLK